MYSLLTALGFGALFALTEILKRVYGVDAVITRRIAHVGSSVVSAAMVFWLGQKEIVVLAVVFLILLTISKKAKLLQGIHAVSRTTWGELFFPLAVLAAALIFLPDHREFYWYSLLTMGLADTAANMVGAVFPKRSTRFSKSISGSGAFCAVALIVGLFFLTPVQALLLAVILALVEHVSPYGSDNLTIILASSALLLV